MIGALNPLVLMILGSVVVMGAGGWLFAADRRLRAAQQRIANVASTRSQAPTKVHGVRRPWASAPTRASAISQVRAYLGIETDRPDLYPVPWWMVLAIACVFALALVGLGAFFIGSVAWFSLPVSAFFLIRMAFKIFQNRRTAQLYSQLPDALGMIVRSVRVGFTVQDAMRIVGEEGRWPTSTEFRRVGDEIRVGGSLQDALTKLARRSQLLEYRFLAVALALQSQSGGSLSETLENLADVVRKRVALKERGIALASEARMTMWVLGCLPFVVAGGLMVLSPAYLAPLVTTPGGKKLLFIGMALLVMGFGSMKIIIKKSVS
jgi:tight adherence protein B